MKDLEFEEVLPVAQEKQWLGTSTRKIGVGNYRFNFYLQLANNVLLGLSETSHDLYFLRVFADEQHVKTFSGPEVQKLYRAAKEKEDPDRTDTPAQISEKESLVGKVRIALEIAKKS